MVSFDEYKRWLEKYKKNNDVREITIQIKVVMKFISTICTNLDVEICSIKGPDSKKHSYLQYCGTYTYEKIEKDKKIEIKKPSTPDLVIAKNWNWRNIENEVDYRVVVEVKSPFEKQSIYNKDYSKYNQALKNQLKRHLSAKKNNKVILTDALKWEFYKKTGAGNELAPIRTFRLYDLSGGKWEWKKDEFKELKNYLKEFLEKKK